MIIKSQVRFTGNCQCSEERVKRVINNDIKIFLWSSVKLIPEAFFYCVTVLCNIIEMDVLNDIVEGGTYHFH